MFRFGLELNSSFITTCSCQATYVSHGLLKVLETMAASPLINVYCIPLLPQCRTPCWRCILYQHSSECGLCWQVTRMKAGWEDLEVSQMAKIFVAFNHCNYLCISKLFFFFSWKLGVLSSSHLLIITKFIVAAVYSAVNCHLFSGSTFLLHFRKHHYQQRWINYSTGGCSSAYHPVW